MKIAIHAAQTAIVSNVTIGEGDEARNAQIAVPLVGTGEHREMIEKLIQEEIHKSPPK